MSKFHIRRTRSPLNRELKAPSPTSSFPDPFPSPGQASSKRSTADTEYVPQQIYAPPSLQNANPNSTSTILLEEPRENPCRCCCDLITAAKVLTVLNLILLGLRILRSVIMDRDKGNHNHQKYKSTEKSPFWPLLNKFGYHCVFPVPGSILAMSGIEMMVWLIVTICFLVAVFGNPGVKAQILYSNMYMWINFCNPAFLIGLIHLVSSIIKKDCAESIHVWGYFITGFVIGATWVTFNGLVAKGFRNALQRTIDSPEGSGSQLAVERATSAMALSIGGATARGDPEVQQVAGGEPAGHRSKSNRLR